MDPVKPIKLQESVPKVGRFDEKLIATTDYVPPQEQVVGKAEQVELDPQEQARLEAKASGPKLLSSTVHYINGPGAEENLDFEVDSQDAEEPNGVSSLDPEDPAKIRGKPIAGTYQMEELLGKGGMAYVYSAVDVKNSNRKVAIKILKSATSGAVEAHILRRFIREGKTMKSLEHKNIVPIYGFGNDGDIQYIAMELVEGGTFRRSRKQLNTEEKLLIIADVCDALHYAHLNDIVHRDVKPENILLSSRLTNDDFPVRPITKLADFGLILIPDASRISKSRDVVGSVYYMSPEQANGERGLTGLSDLYSVGIVLYEIVTGNVPFHGGGNMLSVLEQQKTAIPKAPSELGIQTLPGLEPLIMMLLQKNPSYRHYNSAKEVSEELRNVVCPKDELPKALCLPL